MTGFGQASLSEPDFSVNVEIKALNSKFLDVIIRLPKLFYDKELEVRNMLAEGLERGKVSISIDYQELGKAETKTSYNEDLFVKYYHQLRKLADRVVAPHDQLFQIALNSPDVIQNKEDQTDTASHWPKIKEQIQEAIDHCDTFRITEGKILSKKLHEYIQSIDKGLERIVALDPGRVQKIKERLSKNLMDVFGKESIDANRLEQEMIFYIEKLDIQEERVRLKTHLDYFINVLQSPESNGKKLQFISQEIGREINTIGSKANDAEIQKEVIMMKEELEKIKEQLNNVL